MPIYKTPSGVTVYRFGHGDILIAHTRPKDGARETGLGFISGKPGKVGREGKEFVGKYLHKSGCKLQFVFASRQSLLVLKQAVDELLEQMD